MILMRRPTGPERNVARTVQSHRKFALSVRDGLQVKKSQVYSARGRGFTVRAGHHRATIDVKLGLRTMVLSIPPISRAWPSLAAANTASAAAVILRAEHTPPNVASVEGASSSDNKLRTAVVISPSCRYTLTAL